MSENKCKTCGHVPEGAWQVLDARHVYCTVCEEILHLKRANGVRANNGIVTYAWQGTCQGCGMNFESVGTADGVDDAEPFTWTETDSKGNVVHTFTI